MYKIQHFSFDLWLTLIKSNPKFKIARAEYFYKNFNFLNKSINQIELIFREVDIMCNSINEKTGKNIDCDEMYLMVLYRINNSLNDLNNETLKQILKDMESLVYDYTPQLYDEKTLITLNILKSKGYSLNILSNTAFIKGKVLRNILRELELYEYFDFFIFSDEVGYSKPNFKIFDLVWSEVLKTKLNSESILKSEVLHIGDSIYADIEGSTNFGFSNLRINFNNYDISKVLEYAA